MSRDKNKVIHIIISVWTKKIVWNGLEILRTQSRIDASCNI